MNISRIDSDRGRKYLSSVRMNISRIYFLGNVKTNPAGKKGLPLPGIRQEIINCKLRIILPITG